MEKEKNSRGLIIFVAILIVVAVGLYFALTAVNKNMSPQNVTSLQITVLKEGNGREAKAGDIVSVNYTGMLSNGTKFDSNVDPQFKHVSPFEFALGAQQVIAGWDQGIIGMKVGEKRRLVIPAELAYGSNAIGQIPANSTLIFEVELIEIK